MNDSENQPQPITAQGIIEHALELIKDVNAPHHKILSLLSEKVRKIDFNRLASVPPEEEVPIWKLNVIAVDEILILAQQHHWGICKNREFIYLYNGAYWFNLDSEQLMGFLGDVSYKLGIPRLRSRHHEFRKKLQIGRAHV